MAGPTLEALAQLGPLATGVAALVALVVGIVTIAQKNRADRRDQWWKRTQWALDAALDDDENRAAVGLAALTYLGESRLAKKDESALLEWRGGRSCNLARIASAGQVREQAMARNSRSRKGAVRRSSAAGKADRTKSLTGRVAKVDGSSAVIEVVQNAGQRQGGSSPLDVASERDPHSAAEAARPAVEDETGQPTLLEVNAARLRLVTDRKQGKHTPQWVRQLAEATAGGH